MRAISGHVREVPEQGSSAHAKMESENARLFWLPNLWDAQRAHRILKESMFVMKIANRKLLRGQRAVGRLSENHR